MTETRIQYIIEQVTYGSSEWKNIYSSTDRMKVLRRFNELSNSKNFSVKSRGFCGKLMSKYRLVRVDYNIIREV